jgi:hypothetical protein
MHVYLSSFLLGDAAPDLQWLEDGSWVWVHYIATKIARGELLEAVDALGFVRRHWTNVRHRGDVATPPVIGGAAARNATDYSHRSPRS